MPRGSLALLAADIQTPARVGYPIHLVDLESGTIQESFGSRTGEYPLGTRLSDRRIALGPGRSVWMAAQYKSYEVELWESNTLVRALRREVEWFPPDQESHGWEEKPSPMLAGIAADDSLLWVFAFTADERWAEAGATRDWDRFIDTRIEVIDWRPTVFSWREGRQPRRLPTSCRFGRTTAKIPPAEVGRRAAWASRQLAQS